MNLRQLLFLVPERFMFFLMVASLLLPIPRNAWSSLCPPSPVILNTPGFRMVRNPNPGWKRVLTEIRKAGGSAFPSSDRQFRQVMENARTESPQRQMERVNRFFNQWPYRKDAMLWGGRDYWATPAEFIRKSGDCEDYAIVKYFALRELGFSDSDLRIVVVRDRIRNVGHSVLIAFSEGEGWVLDSMSNLLLPQDRYTHYIPRYSLNESGYWSHVPTRYPVR